VSRSYQVEKTIQIPRHEFETDGNLNGRALVWAAEYTATDGRSRRVDLFPASAKKPWENGATVYGSVLTEAADPLGAMAEAINNTPGLRTSIKSAVFGGDADPNLAGGRAQIAAFVIAKA